MFKTYFISELSNQSIIKIGKSYNPEKRLQSLQSSLGKKLHLLRVVNFDIESELHHTFKDISIGGEWFHDDGRISALINDDQLIDSIVSKKAVSDFGLSNDFDYKDCIKTINGFFVATELVKKANKTRKVKFNLSQWLRTSSVVNLSEKIKGRTNCDAIVVTRGNNGKVLLNPAIFSLLLSSLNIDFKIDSLMAASISNALPPSDLESSKNMMIGSFFSNSKNKSLFHSEIHNIIKDIESKGLSESELVSVFTNAAHFCSVFNNDDAVRLALVKAV